MAVFTVKPHNIEDPDYNPEEHGSFIENVNLVAHRIRVTEAALYQDIEQIVSMAYRWAALPYAMGEPDPVSHPGEYSAYAYSELSNSYAVTSKFYSDQVTLLTAVAHGLLPNEPATAHYDAPTGVLDIGIPTGMGPTGATGPVGPVGPGIDVKGTLPYADIIALDPLALDVGDIYIVSVDHLPEAVSGDGMIWNLPVGGDPVVDGYWSNFGQLRGPQGPQGDHGITGPSGPAGSQGEAGSVWYDGADIPPPALGKNQDFYLVSNVSGLGTGVHGEYYEKIAGTWVQNGTLTGPQGDIGLTGPTGNTGATGSVGASGADGTDGTDGAIGAPGLGFKVGSGYDAGTGVVTFLSDDGLGFSTNDLRGPVGAQGPSGADGATVIVDNSLSSSSIVNALSANMGKVLDEKKLDTVATGITGANPLSNAVHMTQAAYNALGSYDANTLYVLKG